MCGLGKHRPHFLQCIYSCVDMGVNGCSCIWSRKACLDETMHLGMLHCCIRYACSRRSP